MTRSDVVLAVMAAGGPSATFGPVQIQKLLFLVDREFPGAVGGPHFDFRPYDYGPFDRAVYSTLELLSAPGKVAIDHSGRYRHYVLTPDGFAAGTQILATLPPEASTFIQKAATWIRSVNFNQLVSTIYQYYPEMRVNSIF